MHKHLLRAFVIGVCISPAAGQDPDLAAKVRLEISELTERVEGHPRDFAAWYNRGLAHEQIRDYDRAIADYVRALDPRNDFSKLVGTKEEYRALAHHYLGRVFHWHKHEFAKAVNNYTEALRLDPSIEMVHYRRGRALHALKKYAEAERDFAEALRRDPNYSNLLVSWAWQLATCPDATYRDGARAVELALKANQAYKMKSAPRLDVLAASYAEAGDFGKAVATQEKAIALLKDKDKELKASMERRIALYRTEQPFRDPSGRTPID